MHLNIKVVPSAKKNLLKNSGSVLKIYLKAPAIDGKANLALISFLADEFHVKPQNIQIIKGLKSRNKIVNIETI